MNNARFRPQDLPKSYIMKQRLRYGRTDTYNWQTRVKWYPVGWGLNKRVIGDIFGRLHYLACHSPKPVRQRWRKAYKAFEAKYFASRGKASMRYLNNRTAHAWL